MADPFNPGQSGLTSALLRHPLYADQQGQQSTQQLAQALQDYGGNKNGGGSSPTGMFDMNGPYNQLGGRPGGYSDIGDLLSNATMGGGGMFGPTASGPVGSGLGGLYTMGDATAMVGGPAGLELGGAAAGGASAGVMSLMDLLPLLAL